MKTVPKYKKQNSIFQKEQTTNHKVSFSNNSNTFIDKLSIYSDNLGIINNNIFIIALFFLFSYTFFMNAWVCDDAFITFRTVSNFTNGFGLTWNIEERVQAYTHPLWMFLISIFYAFTNEPYFTSIIISFIINIATLYILFYRISTNNFTSIISLLLLISSPTFIDWTSSGLENSLSFLIAITYFSIYIKQENQENKFYNNTFFLFFIASFSVLNRMDTILIYLPSMIEQIFLQKNKKVIFQLIIGFSPFIIWELFSLFYYGFLFPNTAAAKLNTGADLGIIIQQGFYYIQDAFVHDYFMLSICFFIIISVIFRMIINKIISKHTLVAFGVLIYVLYIISIGGDFMSGRFFSVPVFISIYLYSNINFNKKGFLNIVLFFLTLIFGFISNNNPLFSTANFAKEIPTDLQIDKNNPWGNIPFTNKYGICNERAFHYQECGLLPLILKGKTKPSFPTVEQAIQSSHSEFKVYIRGGIGMFGYYAGYSVHIIDYNSLADAFLARIPITSDELKLMRIGHIIKNIPKGYFESICTNTNQIEDVNLSKYYDKLSVLIKSPLFSIERISTIISFNLHEYDNLIHSNFKPINKQLYSYSGDSVSVSDWIAYIASDLSQKEDYFNSAYYYNKSIDYNKNNIRSINGIIAAYSLQNKFDSAYSYAKQLIRIDKNNKIAMRFFIMWSDYFAEQNNFAEAIKKASLYLELDKNSPEIYYYLGNYNYELSLYNQAIENWTKAITINPDFIDPYYQLLDYYLKNNDLIKSANMAKEIIELGGKLDNDIINILKPYIQNT